MKAHVALAGLATLITVGLLAACNTAIPPRASPRPPATATATHFRTWTPVPTRTPSGTPTPGLTPTITPTVPTLTLSVEQMTDSAAVVRIGRLSWSDETEGVGPPWTFGSLDFFAAAEGWALGQAVAADRWIVGLTRDAGETWVLRSLPAACNLQAGTSPQILFRDERVGWAWCDVLWSTADGGATWVAEMSGNIILAWGRGVSGWLWLLWETPDDGLHLQGLSGPHQADWIDPAILPAAWTISGMADRAYPPIAVADDRTLLISAIRRETSLGHGADGWWLTGDGGITWRQVTMPCPSGLIEDQEVAIASADVIWVNCGGMGAMQGIGKAFWRSGDGGGSWQLMAATAGFPADDGPAALLPWRAFPYRLIARGGDFAYTFMYGINAPAITHDAGRTWRFPRLKPCVPYESIAWGTVFDDRYGYSVGVGGLARTSDGGLTWECLLYPEPTATAQP